MNVFAAFKEFYEELKQSRTWKEQHWNIRHETKFLHFRYKPHIFNFYASIDDDKRTYILQEEGTKKVTPAEWDAFFKKLEDNEIDSLFISDEERKNGAFTKSIATGPSSAKMKSYYDSLLQHQNANFPVGRGYHEKKRRLFFTFHFPKRKYPVFISFDWDNNSVTLEDTPRRLNKTFFSNGELLDYLKKYK